ncbi:MAG: hypothetical protein A3I09_02375 [Deltaproteobacteria bacterium RIFCSPLOWO2_02_FULL_47_10]|nr:MAG: hypothetical protein A3I09_02375 [Deltaproteobacteria bacterium RIFCSPLOWO2_02_FULL_47_10]
MRQETGSIKNPPIPPFRGGRGGIILLLASCLLLLSSCASSDIFPSISTSLASPLTIAVNSAANRAYLVNSNNKVLYDTGSLQVLDISAPASPVRVGTAELPSFSGGSYLDAANGYLYVTNRLSDNDQDKTDTILRININEASGTFLGVESFSDGSNPFGIAYDITSTNLYLATSESSVSYFPLGTPTSMSSTSLANLSISDGTTLSSSNLREMAILGRQAFISRTNGGVIVFDLDENNVDYYISDFTSPRGIVTDGANIYVVSVEVAGDGTISPTLFVINPASLTAISGNTSATLIDKDTAGIVSASVAVGTDPQEVVVGTNYIFVSNMGSDSVTVINNPAFTANTSITVGDEPFGMAIYSPGGADTHLFVTNVQSNTVSIINIGTLAVAATY